MTLMRTTIRSLAVLIVIALGMALLHGAIQAATGSNAIAVQFTADAEVNSIRQVTGTVYSPNASITPALTSLWQTRNYSFNFTLLPQPPLTQTVSFTRPLYPTDARILTYGISGGYAIRAGQILTFLITSTDAVYFYDYLTQQQVVLEGDHYRVNQIARANRQYRYISTLYFTYPLQYSGFVNETPTGISSDTVMWDVIPQEVGGLFLFDGSILLANTDSPIYTVLLPIVMKQH